MIYKVASALWKKCSVILPDKLYVELEYRKHQGKFPDLQNPQTFNEKLQWLKLHDRQPIYTRLADKYEAKKYVAGIIGEKYVIPTLGVWEKCEDIDFAQLPKQFVLKCTHDSAGVIIVKNKREMNKEQTRTKLQSCLSRNFFYSGREWPYKNIPPRIIAESYIEDNKLKELRDYKFFCFHGDVKCFKVDFDRFIDHRANYYDANGNLMDYGETICPPKPSANIELPENIIEMKALAQKLSNGIPFVRVDFYSVNGKIYFGELTFFPDSGFGRFTNSYQDAEMGSWLDLSKVKATC